MLADSFLREWNADIAPILLNASNTWNGAIRTTCASFFLVGSKIKDSASLILLIRSLAQGFSLSGCLGINGINGNMGSINYRPPTFHTLRDVELYKVDIGLFRSSPSNAPVVEHHISSAGNIRRPRLDNRKLA